MKNKKQKLNIWESSSQRMIWLVIRKIPFKIQSLFSIKSVDSWLLCSFRIDNSWLFHSTSIPHPYFLQHSWHFLAVNSNICVIDEASLMPSSFLDYFCRLSNWSNPSKIVYVFELFLNRLHFLTYLLFKKCFANN